MASLEGREIELPVKFVAADYAIDPLDHKRLLYSAAEELGFGFTRQIVPSTDRGTRIRVLAPTQVEADQLRDLESTFMATPTGALIHCVENGGYVPLMKKDSRILEPMFQESGKLLSYVKDEIRERAFLNALDRYEDLFPSTLARQNGFYYPSARLRRMILESQGQEPLSVSDLQYLVQEQLADTMNFTGIRPLGTKLSKLPVLDA